MKQADKKSKIHKDIELEMIDAAFEFWFNDEKHIPTPIAAPIIPVQARPAPIYFRNSPSILDSYLD